MLVLELEVFLVGFVGLMATSLPVDVGLVVVVGQSLVRVVPLLVVVWQQAGQMAKSVVPCGCCSSWSMVRSVIGYGDRC